MLKFKLPATRPLYCSLLYCNLLFLLILSLLPTSLPSFHWFFQLKSASLKKKIKTKNPPSLHSLLGPMSSSVPTIPLDYAPQSEPLPPCPWTQRLLTDYSGLVAGISPCGPPWFLKHVPMTSMTHCSSDAPPPLWLYLCSLSWSCFHLPIDYFKY